MSSGTVQPEASPRIASSGLSVSVVVSTLGRTWEIGRLLDSLDQQTQKPLEVIIVDQNAHEELAALLASKSCGFPIEHVRTPQARGLSRGRNTGLARCKGDLVVFADDDCWYPATAFEHASRLFQQGSYAIVGGMAADEEGRPINGRFESAAQDIDRSNVWTTSIEWMLFFRREAIQAIGGFDEAIGVGASTPWQSAEGQDAVLRALARGFTARYEPTLQGHHPNILAGEIDERVLTKARSYARGMGYVLGRHGFGLGDMAVWIGRPCIAMGLYTARGRFGQVRYYANVAKGRLEGWTASRRAVASGADKTQTTQVHGV